MQKPNIRTRPNPHCAFCGSEGETLHTELRDKLFGAPGLWTLKQCPDRTCGLIWPDPAPIEEDLPLAYKMYYTHAEPRASSAKLVYSALSRCYWTAIAVPAFAVGLAAERKRVSAMFLEDLSQGTVLDVGCGDGEFLHRVVQSGWTGKGIDFDAAAIASGRAKYGLDLMAGDFGSAEFPPQSFDAITMSHVIEHVPDPVATLKKCGEILKPGGRLIVTTPNSRSLGHQWLGPAWRGLEPPRHLHIFHPALLTEAARRAGLQILRSGSTAANADYVLNASLAIAAAPADAAGVGGGWNIRFAPKSVVLQYREHFAVRRNPELGEEAYLVAERAK